MSDTTNNNKGNKKGRPLLIIGCAVLMVAALSLIPWGKITNNIFKDFNLLSDLFPGSGKSVAEEAIDPELIAAIQEGDDDDDDVAVSTGGTSSGTDKKSKATDAGNNNIIDDSAPVVVKLPSADQVKPKQSARQGDKVVIEDYTINSSGMSHLRGALASGRARIAIIGDSYIEGDILAMNLRSDLQDTYGGSGVGYMYLQSNLTGFRTSVKQTCSGWTVKDIRKNANDAYKSLAGEYFVSTSGANTTYKGSGKLPHLASWSSTRFLFISPEDATITMSIDGNSRNFEVKGSNQVQCLTLNGNTKSATIKTSDAGVIGLGAYLDGNSGVSVDCMSLRGNSGISHRKLNIGLAQQMRQYVDYDLIIVEYGINALSSQQTDYTAYQKLMVKVITRLKACYPNADILVMGIGDRGQKVGGSVKSLPTSPAMVNAQRDAARNAGVLFWDTREAMGGEDAVVKWRNDGMINPDYIHLNAKGGRALGALLSDAIKDAVR